jgi:DNA-binding transcriptional ArsR family regulator
MLKQTPQYRVPADVTSRARACVAVVLQIDASRSGDPHAVLIKPSVTNAIFRALANEHRRWIVEMLASGPASVMELAEKLPITPAGVSQHIQILEKSGLVQSEKSGRVRTCQLDPEKLTIAENWIADRRKSLRRRPLGT